VKAKGGEKKTTKCTTPEHEYMIIYDDGVVLNFACNQVEIESLFSLFFYQPNC